MTSHEIIFYIISFIIIIFVISNVHSGVLYYIFFFYHLDYIVAHVAFCVAIVALLSVHFQVKSRFW